jgi:hypothetical protein
MAIGKTLRFEVFARDEFTCQYCGQRPPDVLLEVDHIHPVSKGGTDDSINLITACFDCNRGKRDKLITDIGPRPDADLAALKIAQEAAELRRFLEAKEELERLRSEAVGVLQRDWMKYLTPELMPTPRLLEPWIERYGADEISRSIIAASAAYSKGRFGYNAERAFDKIVPYVGAILRNRENDRESGAIQ